MKMMVGISLFFSLKKMETLFKATLEGRCDSDNMEVFMMVFCGHPKVFHLRLLLFNGHWTQTSAETKLVELMGCLLKNQLSCSRKKTIGALKTAPCLVRLGWKEGFRRCLFFFHPQKWGNDPIGSNLTRYFSTGLKPPRTASVRFLWGSFYNVSFVGGRLKKASPI